MIMKSKDKERKKIYNKLFTIRGKLNAFSIQQKEATQCTCCILNLHS